MMESYCVVVSPHVQNTWSSGKIQWNLLTTSNTFVRETLAVWKPPSETNWIHSVSAMQYIHEELQQHGIRAFRLRAFHEDALENLFGASRSGCGCNGNPTVSQFVSSLKTRITNGLTSPPLQGTVSKMTRVFWVIYGLFLILRKRIKQEIMKTTMKLLIRVMNIDYPILLMILP